MNRKFFQTVLTVLCLFVFPRGANTLNSEKLLSDWVTFDEKPWLRHEANSEQRHPLYIGALPYEIVTHSKKLAEPVLRKKLKNFGEIQLLKLCKDLNQNNFEVETWPYLNDDGDMAWAFARWREGKNSIWIWLEESEKQEEGSFEEPMPHFPTIYRPWVEGERTAIFKDFLKLESLYQKPVFGDSVWTNSDGSEILAAWLPLSSMKEWEKKAESERLVARVLPQPARFNEKPISFVVRVEEGKVIWPKEIVWKEIPNEVKLPLKQLSPSLAFPNHLEKEYRDWIERLSGKNSKYVRKNSTDPKNQLEEMVDEFENYYQKLGIETYRQTFKYRGISQTNLIAKIKGSLVGKANRPVLYADHYDTAYEEDTFERTGKRISTAGANDNTTATASLLVAAKALNEHKPRHDIWLVHFTGEEYPADDLGARYFLSQLLKTKTQIKGLVLIDMIGFRKKGDPIFQINLGAPEYSRNMGETALASAHVHAPALKPVIRGRYDERSYLYNTDGYIFSNLGFPVVYFNEHLNRVNMSKTNPHYHQSTDLPENVDFSYAFPISLAATRTVWELANEETP